MTRALDDQEEHRKSALTAFLDARVREGYRIETRTTRTRSSRRPSDVARSSTCSTSSRQPVMSEVVGSSPVARAFATDRLRGLRF